MNNTVTVRRNCQTAEERVDCNEHTQYRSQRCFGGTDYPDRILQTALAAWRQGNFVAVANQFNDQFTFTDHALGLEFKDKGRLTEFLAKTRELFPDSERKANTIFSSGDRVISEWTLTATQTEPFLGVRLKVPIC